MDISRLQTDRSLSLLTHILFRANLPPELDFTRNTIAKPPSARTSWMDLKNIYFLSSDSFCLVEIKAMQMQRQREVMTQLILLRIRLNRTTELPATNIQVYISLPTSTTTECLPMLNFFPIKLLCAFSFSFSSFLLWAGSPNIFFISENDCPL